ncbi:hypothetical protein [uncultured Bacteroides sp.]|uniref:hypothetical protein n=1 Tax=uncultured Bacteroides sp. TaxID=162156 RepID=UPI00262180A8|nr:hypothetical protein [uncultured Bacteroides sp.]
MDNCYEDTERRELKRERDRCLYAAYLEALRDPDVKGYRQAINKAIASPTCRFWISPLQAYRYIMRIKKQENRPIATGGTRKRIMEEVYRLYEEMSENRAFKGRSVYFIASFLVHHEAPEFYLSYDRAYFIINKMKKRKHSER